MRLALEKWSLETGSIYAVVSDAGNVSLHSLKSQDLLFLVSDSHFVLHKAGIQCILRTLVWSL